MQFRCMIAALLIPVLFAGCGSANVGLRAGGASQMRSAVSPGTSYSFATVEAEANPNAYFGMFFLGSFLLGVQGEFRHRDQAYGRKPPEMAPGRSVVERDCSKPLEQLEANLRCR